MIGRCLRPQPGKTAVVLDHVGNTLRLGHHLEERDWTLDGLRKRDREAAPSVKVCPTCFATSPSTAQVCRDCGHVFAPPERRELRQVEGELQEIAVTKRREQGKATDLEALPRTDCSNAATSEDGRSGFIKLGWPRGMAYEQRAC
jgi:DNA repair protein RadD